MTRLKLFTFGLALVLALAGLVAAQLPAVQGQDPSASEIMTQSKVRWQGQDFSSPVVLTTVEAGGGETVLEVDFRSRLVEESRESGKYRYKVLARVTEPEDSKGLAVLIQEQQFPTSDDIWLFLPALQSTKKIVPENFRNPLFGSEFVFEDVVGREPGIDTHQLQGSKTITVGDENLDAWAIKSTPNEPDVAGFAYRVTYVGKDSYLRLRMELYDGDDELVKLYQAREVETLQDIPTWTWATAENRETGRVSTFEFTEPTYNTGLPDELFDPDEFGQQ